MSSLPDEVLDRLSILGEVRLVVWLGEESHRAMVPVAPLQGTLFLMVSPGGAIEQALLADGRAEVIADGKDARGEWSIRATGRAVVGRLVVGETRRSELMHWMPEKALPQRLLALRFLPEYLDYSKGSGPERQRANGAIPKCERPTEASRWSQMAIHGALFWIPGMGIVTWGGILSWVPASYRTLWLLGLMLGIAIVLYSGGNILARYGMYLRWREGIGQEEELPDMLNAWEAPLKVRNVGLSLLGIGSLLVGLLGIWAGHQVVLTVIIASGLWLLGPVHVLRYLFRRTDAAVEG